ncbi:MAG: hypothetical protein AAF623_08410 [Planctomycetota bacterium]
MKLISGVRALLAKVHSNEKGGVSLETILIIGAIALPILIFLITIGWPRVQQFFDNGMDQLDNGSRGVYGGTQ